MADIAFLLLIFFLVATVIDVDTGIGMTLPEISDLDPPPVSKDRMAAVLINENNDVLLDGKPISLFQIKVTLGHIKGGRTGVNGKTKISRRSGHAPGSPGWQGVQGHDKEYDEDKVAG